MMEENPGPPLRKHTHRWPLVSGIAAVALAALLGAVILAQHNGPLPVDQVWMQQILAHRTGWLDVPAFALDSFGGGPIARILVPAVVILVLVLLRQRWAALYFALAVLLSLAAVQLLKTLFDRPRPAEGLVVSDAGSFPSGHVANAATAVVALALIFRRGWIWYVGALYTLAMALSRTYLGAHWLSDTVGGALLGAGIAAIVWVPLAARLNPERKRPQATDSVSPTL